MAEIEQQLFSTESVAKTTITEDSEFDKLPDKEEPKKPLTPTPPANSAPPRSPRASRHSARAATPVNEASVETVCKQCVARQQVAETNPNVIAAAVCELENTRNDLMRDGHIRESLDYQKAIDYAQGVLTTSQKVQAQKEYMEVIQRKKEENQRKKEQQEQEMQKIEQDFELKAKTSIDRLKQQQKNELDYFDGEWQSEKKVREYNRLSSKLREMRHQQELLISARRFEEAAQVQKLADIQQQKETEISSRAMLNDFLNARRKVETRHQAEMDCLVSSFDGKRSELKAYCLKERIAYEKRTKVLENEEKLAQDPEHVWIITHKNEEPLTNQYRTMPRSANNTMSNTLAPKYYGTLTLPPLQELKKKSNC